MGNEVVRDFPRYFAGVVSAFLALFFLLSGRWNFPILFASAFIFVICLMDTLYSRIPNLVTVAMALAGIAYNFSSSGPTGLAQAILGLLTGFSLFLVPFLLGGMGGGDVKALAAMGALLGPGTIFQVFLYTALFGGALSMLHILMRGNIRHKMKTWWATLYIFLCSRDRSCFKPSPSREKLRFPYASAIAFGYFAFLIWGRIV